MRQPTSITLERSITRADGIPRPGDEAKVAAYWHRNPLKRLAYRLRGGKGKVSFHASRRPSSG